MRIKWSKTVFIMLAMAQLAMEQSWKVQAGKKPRWRKRGCKLRKMDIYLMVETSVMVGEDSIQFVRSYLKEIIKRMTINSEYTHVSLTSFGRNVQNHWQLEDDQDEESINSAIDELSARGFGAWARTAMKYVANNLFSTMHGRRSNQPAICVLIVGFQFYEDYRNASTLLQEKCRLVAVGAKYVRLPQLFEIASEPSSKHVIYSRKYEELPKRAIATVRTICDKPLVAPRLESGNLDAFSVNVSWRPQPFAASYSAKIMKKDATVPLQQITDISAEDTSVYFDGLEEATHYVVYVWASDASRKTGPAGRIIVATGITPPEIQIDGSSITTTSVNVSWDREIEGLFNYFITLIDVDNQETPYRHPIGGTSVIVRGLSPGTEYFVSLSLATHPDDNHPEDNISPIQFMTNPVSPKLVVSQVTLNSIDLKWNPIKGAVRYTIHLRNIESEEESVVKNTTETKFKCINLVSSRGYEFKATATSKIGVLSDPPTSLIVYTAPPNPNNITTVHLSENAITVQWNPQEGAISYEVLVKLVGQRKPILEEITNSIEFGIRSLEAGTFYTIHIFSIGKNNVKDVNIQFPARIQTVPDPPTQLRANTTDDNIRLTWTPSKGVYGTNVFLRQINSTTAVIEDFTNVVNVTDEHQTVVDLSAKPGLNYEIKLQAIGLQGGQSKMSRVLSVSTQTARLRLE